MKIAVSAMGPDLNAQVDPRLGRCQYLIIVNPETMEFEAIQNASLGAMHGAGIQTAQMIANKGVSVVLTGNSGPNAFQTLSAAGIQVIVGVSGQVKQAIERYKRGEFKSTNQATVPPHFGTGAGSTSTPGMTPGMGMGGGRGMGRGGGMGRGMMGGGFQGMPYGPGPGTTPQQMPKDQELQFLKNQAQILSQQLEEINKRIKEIEKKNK
ncbi:MAG: NifB/NifX family molybdenum-iron cluster-binding protein [Candidatus Aerophobetes bacterium]|nr:NifB/NifX family molybdenum-iron cluster-binding protein [Candidatus Aerophobetes bacterium]